MGLDERPGNSLEHMGLGHGRAHFAVEIFAQLPPPRVQQRSRLRRDAGNARSAVETTVSVAAASEPVVGLDIRRRHCPARHRLGADPGGDSPRKGCLDKGADRKDWPSNSQGLRALPGAEPISVAQNLGRKRGRQPFAQHLGVRVRALCDKYDLPYTSGSLVRQYLLTLRTIHKLAAPDSFLSATSD